jgi:peptidoglycan/LPS O-acetylase OafA/YrhL
MSQRISQLDGVRGIAILTVMVHNLNAFSARPFSYLTTYGWMGVDLFFVLSGFLITGILLDTKESEAYFRNFYMRRCLRIWPLYYAVLLFIFVLVPLVRHEEAFRILQTSSPRWSYLFFLQNFFVPVPTNAFGPLAVTWSLAVEELFYIVWPMFVRFLSTTQLRLVAWSVIVLSPVLRLFLTTRHVIIYSNPFCRFDGLMAGALLALLIREGGFRPVRFTKTAWVALLVATPLTVVAEEYSARWLTFSLTITASAALVYLALHSRSTGLRYLLTNRFLTFTGTISYGLYLLHKFPHDLLKAAHVDLQPTAAFLPVALCGYLLAIMSWNLLEKPLLRLKSLFEDGPAKTVAAEISG